MAEAVLAPAAAPQPPGKMTYEEFLDWADEDTRAEWVDGEVILMSPASGEHQDLGSFLISTLKCFVQARDLGIIRYEMFQMKTGPDLPGRLPDILFVAKEHLHRLEHTSLRGPADLAIEIVSPESRARDRGAKFYEYEKGGVQEYWLLDPERRRAEFYNLGVDDTYYFVPVGNDGIFRSTVVDGLWIQVEWLWTQPPVLDVLREWALI